MYILKHIKKLKNNFQTVYQKWGKIEKNRKKSDYI